MDIKQALLELRSSRGWTQQELADHLHMRQSTVGCWESGLRYPSLAALIKLEILSKGQISARAYSPDSFEVGAA